MCDRKIVYIDDTLLVCYITDTRRRLPEDSSATLQERLFDEVIFRLLYDLYL